MGENDFDFYEEDTEVDTTTREGITGTVTNFTYTGISYPCIIFKDGFTCPKHKLKIISNMVKSVKGKKDISLYFQNKGELFKIGELNGFQVSSLLEIVETSVLTGYYDKDTSLEGDLVYTLCSVV